MTPTRREWPTGAAGFAAALPAGALAERPAATTRTVALRLEECVDEACRRLGALYDLRRLNGAVVMDGNVPLRLRSTVILLRLGRA